MKELSELNQENCLYLLFTKRVKEFHAIIGKEQLSKGSK